MVTIYKNTLAVQLDLDNPDLYIRIGYVGLAISVGITLNSVILYLRTTPSN